MLENDNREQPELNDSTDNRGMNNNGQSYGNYSGANYNYGNNNQGTSYGNGNYSDANGNSSYGSSAGYNGGYNGNGYGTYQYGSYQQPQGGGQPPRKKGNGKKVAAVIAVALVLILGLSAGYYSMTRIRNAGGLRLLPDIANNEKDVKEAPSGRAPEKEPPAAEEATPQEEETEEPSESVASAQDNSGSGISRTELGAGASAVVTDVTDVVAAAMPAIVSINNNYTESASYFGQKYTEELTASGSGIIVGTNDTELLIVTNYHVIEGADSLEVFFANDNTENAEVKGTDSDMDLAVIAVPLEDLDSATKNAIAIASLGDSDSLVVGEPAIAIGNALGYGQSVTTGVISAVNRVIDLDDSTTGTFIQTDAAINPGNSGGALLNIKGEVIGINSNKIGGSTIEGMGYAIPISTARPIIEQLMTEKTRAKASEETRGYLGISGVSVTSDVSDMYGLPKGVYVASVSETGGAAAAGVREGDIITQFDGKEISSMDDLQNRIAYYEAGESVNVTIMRQSADGYSEQELTIVLGTSATLQTEDGNDTNGPDEGDSYQDDTPEEDDDYTDPYEDFFNPFGFGFDFGN